MIRRSTLVGSFASVAGASVLAMATAALTGSCASAPDQNRTTTIAAPAYDQFKGSGTQVGLDPFLEKRCATLDCHGQVGRPLRLYSSTGLRFPAADVQNAPGGAGTTELEIQANYQAVIGLEPEQMSRVVLDPTNNPPQSLLLVKKPRALERHKGGAVVIAGDDGDSCITSWLSGTINSGACQSALMVP